LRGVAFTDRDEHVARQSVDPPVAFLTFRRYAAWESRAARRPVWGAVS
jgi:hypothetical protein